jgi:hypothetical protein
MSTPTPAVTNSPPFNRPISIEAFAALTTASVIGMAWWMGSLAQAREPACQPRGRVTSAQVEAASERVREAARRAAYTRIAGSGYAAAKAGLARSSPEFRLAQAAASELASARTSLERLCAVSP